jgi:hypothetical protein
MPIAPLDFAALGIDSLPSRFADKPKIIALVTALAHTFQQADDLLQLLQFHWSLDDAEGVQLDHLGQFVGQPRDMGDTDDEYRPMIAARSLANRSCGTTEELIEIVKLLLPNQLAQARFTDVPPAHFVCSLRVLSALSTKQQATVRAFLKLAKCAGVGFDVSYWVSPVFAWHRYPYPPGAGWGTGTPGVGGKWAVYF